eukprot:TRINITY_DN59098_c0_g1_i1.p1 TRINITY_DN59098_c0_g1~~TRINITY_DN59098_c0_g1_i1.p1  ORF type:complete len:309 (-),score=60.39 TRINITY_DN59098_c0_g1_i1:34-960(-)
MSSLLFWCFLSLSMIASSPVYGLVWQENSTLTQGVWYQEGSNTKFSFWEHGGLILQYGNNAIWQSGTACGNGENCVTANSASFTSNCELETRDSSGNVQWTSDTDITSKDCKLVLQADGNLVIKTVDNILVAATATGGGQVSNFKPQLKITRQCFANSDCGSNSWCATCSGGSIVKKCRNYQDVGDRCNTASDPCSRKLCKSGLTCKYTSSSGRRCAKKSGSSFLGDATEDEQQVSTVATSSATTSAQQQNTTPNQKNNNQVPLVAGVGLLGMVVGMLMAFVIVAVRHKYTTNQGEEVPSDSDKQEVL